MTATQAKQTWTDRYRRDPDLAQSIVENLQRSIMEADARIDKLEAALGRIAEGSGCRECGGESQAQIAKEALE